ncbi:AraC family transcriptional regulator [Flavihumibacter rivuli]|uniref:helix-turn-helix transcriptional regulator n=1 Tax=Flavihumibacter rivuli TaxID=2838156 RepID=UPI001BDF495E|nr:AraC family transcriptional regulator [Flavihumibacter rivuli]ULQ55452.1 AraC family transcriptional regulator [Flavihumibacter rivuli]
MYFTVLHVTEMTDLYHKALGKLLFYPYDDYHIKGPYLAGSEVKQTDVFLGTVRLQSWTCEEFSLEHRWFNFSADAILEAIVAEQGLRLEILLSGNLEMAWGSLDWRPLQAGQYWFSNFSATRLQFQPSSAPQILVVYLPESWYDQLAANGPFFQENQFYALVPEMLTVLDDLMHHDYTPNLHRIFYEKCCRDLLFHHLLIYGPKPILPENEPVPAFVLEADAIISADLTRHYRIEELAQMVGTNTTYLKKAFKQYFKQGVFDRLQELRLQQAREQLLQTNMSIKDIAMEAGYQHVANFTNAFRKRFGMSPSKWRGEKGM